MFIKHSYLRWEPSHLLVDFSVAFSCLTLCLTVRYKRVVIYLQKSYHKILKLKINPHSFAVYGGIGLAIALASPNLVSFNPVQ